MRFSHKVPLLCENASSVINCRIDWNMIKSYRNGFDNDKTIFICTVKLLNIGTHIVLRLEQFVSFAIHSNDAYEMVNSVDPDQTAP